MLYCCIDTRKSVIGWIYRVRNIHPVFIQDNKIIYVISKEWEGKTLNLMWISFPEGKILGSVPLFESNNNYDDIIAFLGTDKNIIAIGPSCLTAVSKDSKTAIWKEQLPKIYLQMAALVGASKYYAIFPEGNISRFLKEFTELEHPVEILQCSVKYPYGFRFQTGRVVKNNSLVAVISFHPLVKEGIKSMIMFLDVNKGEIEKYYLIENWVVSVEIINNKIIVFYQDGSIGCYSTRDNIEKSND